MGTDYIYFLDTPEILRMRIDGPFTHGTFEIPFGHRRIKRFTIVKLHPFSKHEIIGKPVQRYRPVRCQPRYKPAVAVHLDESFEDICKHHPVDGCRRVGCGIESGRLRGLADNQAASLLRARCHGMKHRNDKNQQQDEKYNFLHGVSSRSLMMNNPHHVSNSLTMIDGL